jgi:hypothetical protein
MKSGHAALDARSAIQVKKRICKTVGKNGHKLFKISQTGEVHAEAPF